LLKILLYISVIVLPACAISQQFNYVHYDTKDGLAGSTVYDMCQDRDGFMWFATENGLSRYDGTSFRNFTVKDGLPDNEVLKVFSDNKGRTWVGTFNKDICYYYKGRFYTRHNDSTVAAISFNSNLMATYEYDNGLVVLISYNSITTITKDNKVKNFSYPVFFDGTSQVKYCIVNKKIFLGPALNNKYYLLNMDNGVSEVTSDTLLRLFSAISFLADFLPLSFDSNGVITKKIKPSPVDVISMEPGHNSFTYINSNNGSWQTDVQNEKLGCHFLPGKRITRTVTDKENNLWFSTFGEGVYKLPSLEIKTFTSPQSAGGAGTEIFTIAKAANNILAGALYSKLLLADNNDLVKTIDFSQQMDRDYGRNKANRLYCIKILSSGIPLLGFDGFITRWQANKTVSSEFMSLKSIDETDKEHIVVGTASFAYKLRLSDLAVTDTIWKNRCTKVFYYNNHYYIGTINGLYQVDTFKKNTFLGTLHPTLSRRITDIKATPDGQLWVASSDNGIVAFKNGQVTHILKDSNGLSSNICRTLFLQRNFLWAGTNKGLCKIDISKPGMPVIRYSISDGLPSDVINAVYAEDSIIWIGTPAGLTYFNENRISTTSICNLNMLGITVSGRQMPLAGPYNLTYKDNNISFSYVAVSFKSGGEINYYYRLTGLHSDWRQTTNTSLNYQSLPPGDYELELYAINKFGLKSDTIKLSFSINTPYWRAWWFYLLLFAAAITGITVWLQKKAARQRRLLEEKNRMQQQFAALEQQALQAQMNPHFIFNCLNSIQQYNLTADKEKANEYLTGFASLVRQTLDYSGKKTITVAEEAAYLRQYLQMEEMRFGNNFSYSITIDKAVKADFFEIPALLLQPFVENALRHGIRYKQDGSGVVSIHFFMDGQALTCSVKDNGVGRKAAAAYKSQQHIEYQSKGMSLTQKRVELLNKVNSSSMEITITDLADAAGNATGTEVIIKIPV
jgi:Histidine kinase/Y_Y_Y domain/Two component regulator propeller